MLPLANFQNVACRLIFVTHDSEIFKRWARDPNPNPLPVCFLRLVMKTPSVLCSGSARLALFSQDLIFQIASIASLMSYVKVITLI